MNTIWRALLSCGNCWEVNNVTEKTNVPEIRFAGFTDPWEQRKLGELCTFSKGHGYSKADIRDAGTPLILYGRLYTQYESRIEEVDTFTVEQDGSILSRGNEVIIPASGETAEDIAVASSVRRSGIILGGDLNVVTPAGTLDPDYTALAITYSKAHDDLAKRAQGKSVVHVHGNDIAEVEIYYPSESEQKRISSVVLNLDSLITLHQRKHDKLVQLKKSMLDKMFPKPGETEPEIRFAGFTDPWEQRKLGELLLFQNGFNGSSESFGSGIPLISVMDVLDDEFITHETVRGKARLNYEEASRYCVEYGDVLFQRSSENQEDAGTSNVYLDQHVPSAFGGFVIRGKKVDEYNPIFIKYLLGSSFIREQITHRAQGAQHINVSQDTLAGVVLLMPSMREQEAVGLVFLHLANLITLHQRKLELLRNTKKSLLERMFV